MREVSVSVMSDVQVQGLMACADATRASLAPVLGKSLQFKNIATLSELDQALESGPWHLAVCDLSLEGFTALDLVRRLSDEGLDTPVVLVRDTGPEHIGLECLAFGTCHFIELSPACLDRLPQLMNTLARRARVDAARRKLEKRLLESEERYIDIFDNTSDLIQCLAPDGHFLYTNRTWRDTMGYSEAEIRELTLMDVLHPDSLICCQDRFQRLMQGESLSCITFKFITKTGESVHLLGDCGSIIKQDGVISTRGIFKNVTETEKVRDALRVTEARYQALYENAPDVFTTLSPEGQILSINHHGAEILGFSAGELVGESIARLVHPEDQPKVFASIEAHFSAQAAVEQGEDIEYRMVGKGGCALWVHQRVTLEAGQEPRLLVVCRDITDKRNLEAQLAHQASHDALTDLVNRREFERRLQRVLASERTPEEHHALCFLDLDQFKVINDSCGHLAGDELLRQMATLLESQVRSRDTLARLGGDEFAILMEHTSPEKALVLAEKVRATVEQFIFHWRNQTFSVGVSIGVVPVVPGHTLNETLSCADAACYQAKREGRNRICKTDLIGEHVPGMAR